MSTMGFPMLSLCQNQHPIKWRLVIQQHGKTFQYTLNLCDTDTGPQVMQKIKSVYDSAVPHHRWSEVFLFKSPVLETVSLTAYSDLEAQAPHEVFVGDREANPAFTAAFHRPAAFASTVGFVAENRQFTIESQESHGGATSKGILLRSQVNWIGIWIAVAVGLVLSVGVGLIVGFKTHRTDLGVLVSTGMAVFLGVLVAFLAWRYK